MKVIRKIAVLVSLVLGIGISADFAVIKVQAETRSKVAFDKSTETLTITGKVKDEDISKISSFGRDVVNIEMKDVECDDCSSMFQNFSCLETLSINGLKTSNTSDMFLGDKNLKSAEMKNLEVSSITDTNMFGGCDSLEYISLSESNDNARKLLENNGYFVYGTEYIVGDTATSRKAEFAAKNEKSALNYVGQEELDGYKIKDKRIDGNIIYVEYEKDLFILKISVIAVVLIAAAIFGIDAYRKRRIIEL